MVSYVVWLFATRTAKLLPHLWNRPQDVIHVPAFILFGYYFAVMKLYALLTLHEVCIYSIYSIYPFYSILYYRSLRNRIADLLRQLDWMGHARGYRRPHGCDGCGGQREDDGREDAG